MEERRESNERLISFVATAEERLSTIHADIVALNTKVGIQNGRIFKLETWQAFILGGVALIGVLGGMLSIAVVWFKK